MQIGRREAISNFSWKLAEQIGAQSVSFIVSIILARLLYPDDYSVVSIIVILTGFCTVFIDGGLTTALIQKKDTDKLDYSTSLVFSIVVSIVLYWALFFLAPFIAEIYSKPLLIPVVRVYSLNLVVGAFNANIAAYIAKNLLFKKYFFATITGTVISAIVGITMAYQGFGAWALVAQQMLNPLIDTIILFLSTSFRPNLSFSKQRWKGMWKFGSRVLGTSLVDMLYENIRPLIIGIKFTTADLAFYQKGRSYPGIINNTLTSALSTVLFPVLSNSQDNIKRVKELTQKYIQVASYLLFPTLLGLAAVAPNLIVFMLTEKWSGSIPYMQIFCINYMFLILQSGNLQSINAVGRSDIVFKIAIIKKVISFSLLFLVVFVAPNPLWLAALGVVTSLIAFVINAKTNKSLLNYGFFEQIRDIFPNLANSTIMAISVYLIGKIPFPQFPLILIQIVAGSFVYIMLSIFTKNKSFKFCIETIKGYRKKKQTPTN